jgi:NTP pyrophosphatase (non-canonical NTP hydrolase)
MNSKEYIKLSANTDHDFKTATEMAERAFKEARLLHYVLGAGTEVAELQDAVKKHIAYNKPLDVVNIKEEISDCLWYLARISDLYGWTFEEIMELNINKLKKRYGDKFTEEAAINRNIVEERKILEEG